MSAINCSAGLAVVVLNLDVAVAEMYCGRGKICPPRAMNAVLFALDCKLVSNILLHLTHTYQ